MLDLDKISMKVNSVTPHMEKHGKENVLCVALGLQGAVDAKLLDGLDKTLRPLLFRKPGKDDTVQGELPGTNAPGDGLTKRKFTHVKAIDWNDKLLGYVIELGSGLTSTDPEVIEGVKVSGLRFEPMDGGTCVFSCKADFKADAELAGKCAAMLQEIIEVSLYAAATADERQAELV